MLAFLRGKIRESHNAALMRALASASTKFLRAWHNEGHYDFQTNGEKFALQSFVSWTGRPDVCVWDVGAHEGEWAGEAAARLPQAQLYSFEIIPALAQALKDKPVSDHHVIHNFGLAEFDDNVVVCWNTAHTSTSSMAPRVGSEWFEPARLEEVRAKTRAGDGVIASKTAPPPNYLKIDVEGAEAAVLAGLAKTIEGPQAPDLIQFEYGETWIPFKAFLKDVYDQLERAGYSIGRLYPTHVDFRKYAYKDEHFRMGNYVAVKDPLLQTKLGG